ncbi:hypothetical protein ACJZTR_00020 [Neorickettsia risticii]
MYDYVVVGGGIESFLFCFLILYNTGKSNIAFVTKSPPDMSKYSSFSKVGLRHVSTSEYTNLLSKFHLDAFSRRVPSGGWNGIDRALRTHEKYWLKKRLLERRFFYQNLDHRLKNLAFEGPLLWKKFLSGHPEFSADIDLIEGIYAISNHCEKGKGSTQPLRIDDIERNLICGRNVSFESDGFSFNSLKFCKKIRDFLTKNGISFFYNTEISKIDFASNKKLKHVISSRGEIFHGKNYFIAIGANFFGYNDYFNLRKLTQPIVGSWYLVHDVNFKHPLKYSNYVSSILTFWQNYTPVSCNDFIKSENPNFQDGKKAVVVGTGCMWKGSVHGRGHSNVEFIKRNERLIKDLFPGKEVTLLDGNCLRNFSYNSLPIIKYGNSLEGKYLSVSGSGTFTTANAVNSASKAVEFFLGNRQC